MYKKFTLFMALAFLCLAVFSQTPTPVYLSQAVGNSKGFYQYLPADYNTSGKNYPLIIWAHGAGQVGNGTTADLPKVLQLGLPNVISKSEFPSSFLVNGSNYSFIVISPQFISWPSGNNMAAMLTYIQNNYRVDPERIYMLGMSAGGGAVEEFASTSVSNSDKLAAIIPFAGTLAPTTALANRMAASKLPIWAFHNTNDGTVPVANSRNWKNYFNAYSPTPGPLAKLTEFPVGGSNAVILHDCWTSTTVPTYKPEGINIYEWLLQYKRRLVIQNVPPVASAGDDGALVLPGTFTLNGSLSNDPDGVILSYRWRKTNGPASFNISDTTAIKPVLSNLAQGIYTFRLTVTDNSGAVSTDDVSLSVYNATAPGSQQRVLIDVGSSNLTTNPSINGNIWNNMTDARAGVRVANALTTNSAPSGLALEVINRIDGTYSTGANGMGNGNTVGIVNDYPANATTDHALIHSSTTNGRWRIKGMLASNTYTIKFWGARSNTNAARAADIKRSDEAVWKTYNATNNTNYNNAAVFIITGKTEMDFNIRTNANSDFSALNVIDITYTSGTTTDPENLAPFANAGRDTTVSLNTSLTLSAAGSADPDGDAITYNWRLINTSGATLTSPANVSPIFKATVSGLYLVELKVSDSYGKFSFDTVAIMASAVNITPVANAGNDRVIILPINTTTLDGTGSSDVDGSNLNYRWLKIAGNVIPAFNDSIATTTITGLTAGTYSFRLTVTDDAAAIDMDTVIIRVNTVPVANAGGDVYLAYPALSAQLNGSLSNDADGNNLTFKWRVLTGNAGSTIAKSDSAKATFTASQKGTYTVELKVTDSYGSVALDTIRIVISATNVSPVANVIKNILVHLPKDSVQLNGSASADPDGTITQYQWTRISGPAATIVNNSAPVTMVKNLTSGSYQFELVVTDDSSAIDRDTVFVTVNAPAIARAGDDASVTLPTNILTLNGGQSTDTDGTIALYRWRKLSGAAMSFSDSTTAITTATLSAAGVYRIQLVITDNLGAVSTDTVQLTLNPDPNRAPVANAGPGATLQQPANRTLLDGRASTDPDGDAISYQWSYVSGPSGYTLSTPLKDTTTVILPNAGSYVFKLTVTDVRGVTSSGQVTVAVLPVADITKKIKVNIFGGSNPYVNAQWNNWNVSGNLTSSAFKYEDATASTVTANLSASSLIADNGTGYAASATSCPPAVLRFTSANTSYRLLVFSGLDKNKKYDFEFYGSRANTGNSSVYQIGNKLDTIVTNNNANDKAFFSQVSPDNSGQLTVIISRIGTWNYISGFTVTEYPVTAAFARGYAEVPATQNVVDVLENHVAVERLMLHPNPAQDNVTLTFPDRYVGAYSVTVLDINGRAINTISGFKAAGMLKRELNTSLLKKGIYIVRLSVGGEHTSTKLIKL